MKGHFWPQFVALLSNGSSFILLKHSENSNELIFRKRQKVILRSILSDFTLILIDKNLSKLKCSVL